MKLPTLLYRRTLGVMIEAYKILSDYGKYVQFVLKINTSSTRSSSFKLLKPRVNKTFESLQIV